MIRTFIAIDLPPGVRSALGELQEQLRRSGARIRWVKPTGIHLTLKFLGDIEPAQVNAVAQAMRQAAASAAPFRLTPMGCGAFPSIKQMRVVWVGLDGDLDPLHRLRQRLETVLEPLGFPLEKRPFRAHLTIGRVKDRGRLRSLQNALLALQDFRLEDFDVTEVVLYKSELRPDGARYTPLERIAFQAGR